jgi:hypothetical protein
MRYIAAKETNRWKRWPSSCGNVVQSWGFVNVLLKWLFKFP